MYFLKGQLLKATHSMTWLCVNMVHPREVWAAGIAAMQYMSGLLA